MSDINQKISFKKNKNYICRELPEGHGIYSFSFSNFIGGLNVFLVTFKNHFIQPSYWSLLFSLLLCTSFLKTKLQIFQRMIKIIIPL